MSGITAGTLLADLGFITQAPRALAAAGVTTVEQLLGCTREHVAGLRGMGAARLGDVDAVMTAHRLVYGQPFEQRNTAPVCRTCPQCPQCRNPRADDRRHVVADLTGRASHTGHRVAPTCAGCHAHHLALFTVTATSPAVAEGGSGVRP